MILRSISSLRRIFFRSVPPINDFDHHNFDSSEEETKPTTRSDRYYFTSSVTMKLVFSSLLFLPLGADAFAAVRPSRHSSKTALEATNNKNEWTVAAAGAVAGLTLAAQMAFAATTGDLPKTEGTLSSFFLLDMR